MLKPAPSGTPGSLLPRGGIHSTQAPFSSSLDPQFNCWGWQADDEIRSSFICTTVTPFTTDYLSPEIVTAVIDAILENVVEQITEVHAKGISRPPIQTRLHFA